MFACPICKRPALPRAQNAAFPFCSERCKKIDLGQWLEERYRVPASESSDAGESLEAGDTDPRASPEEDR
jgi:endogenous inhibitor of DNA gyrase (YacG/DUF329 family)